jgi:hypothetical protein
LRREAAAAAAATACCCAQDGLRTLVLGRRYLAAAEYEEWSRVHQEARVAVEGRAEKLIEAAAQVV